MELQIPNTGDGTHKATRQELSQIIAFLDAKLPVTLTVSVSFSLFLFSKSIRSSSNEMAYLAIRDFIFELS